MKRLLNYINSNVLFKVASLNSVSMLVKIISGFLTSKAIALYVGAEGMALIGNLRNFLSSVQAVSILGLYNGVVKYVAEFKENTLELSKTISTVFYSGFIATVIVSFFCYFFADELNDYVFAYYNDYAYVIRIMAIALPFYALNMFIFGILNGFSKYKILIVINIIGQIFGLSITILLIYKERIDGALISVVISESLLFFITLVGIANRRSLAGLIQVKHISLDYVKKLSSYSVMAIFSAFLLPIVAIAIRNYITDTVGLKEAGFWEAMNRISRYYLMFVSSLLTLYILPRFSEIDNKKEFRAEVFNFYKSIIPIFAGGLLVIYLLRNIIVLVVFSEEFEPVADLFLWQLLGDFVKVLSIVIAYQFLAKKMFWHYIITEAFSVAILYFMSIYFIDIYGVKGANIAHFASYVLYYGLILLIFSSSLFGVISEDENEDELDS
ncbi:O-antigen translocase [Bizionia algoritergicola]|uniref:O-antigen translocase n=2 Tax=Flavobacteriaceae TaxID=49546 RepID=A0A5D0QUA3_9FLAO|nr:lipopolysaccharide biosynthesis protein [Bizionia sp. APA-3]TYB72767.1 O-antigen translocase [Bizionia algoritergicola]